ncbi:hypothetical protein BGW42_000613 [Actinomortierella wolfii]|nr:hypothetical protein BGW42_000613 [Actinomortierella wolfii]
MARLLSVFATFLIVAIVQVCSALEIPFGVYSLSAHGLYLAAGDHGDVFLDPELETHGGWMIVPDEDLYQIVNVKKGDYLYYNDHEEYSRLILTKNKVLWELDEINGEVIIRVPDSDLVIGMLPPRIFPPLVGLTLPGKGPHSWKLKPIRPDAQLADIPDGDVEIVLHNDMFLAQFDMAVRLFTERDDHSIWRIEDYGSTISIKNRESGLYLSYDPESPNAPIRASRKPSYFVIEKDGSGTRILSAEEYDGERLALSQLPVRVYPPLVGLWRQLKDENQLWHIRNVDELDDDRQQYRLPYKRIRFW